MPIIATMTLPRLARSEKLSMIGFFEVLPADFIAWNTGLSASFMRMKIDTANRPSDIRNGTRQPQASKLSVDIAWRVEMTTIRQSRKPTGAAIWMKLV